MKTTEEEEENTAGNSGCQLVHSVDQAPEWTGALWELSIECSGGWGCGCVLQGDLISDWCAASYAGAAVVGERAAVGQCDKLLLPLLVERAATPLPQDTLRREPFKASEGR